MDIDSIRRKYDTNPSFVGHKRDSSLFGESGLPRPALISNLEHISKGRNSSKKPLSRQAKADNAATFNNLGLSLQSRVDQSQILASTLTNKYLKEQLNCPSNKALRLISELREDLKTFELSTHKEKHNQPKTSFPDSNNEVYPSRKEDLEKRLKMSEKMEDLLMKRRLLDIGDLDKRKREMEIDEEERQGDWRWKEKKWREIIEGEKEGEGKKDNSEEIPKHLSQLRAEYSAIYPHRSHLLLLRAVVSLLKYKDNHIEKVDNSESED